MSYDRLKFMAYTSEMHWTEIKQVLSYNGFFDQSGVYACSLPKI